MPDAYLSKEGDFIDYTPAVAVAAGDLIQIADGRAAVAPTAIAAGVKGAVQVRGIYEIAKTTSIVFLDGGRVFWDYSALKAHFKKVNDRDFYVGRVVGDAASAATTVKVALNVNPPADIDLMRDGGTSIISGTAAAGGFGYPIRVGGSHHLRLTATSEVQKVDVISVDGFAPAANAIIEGVFRVSDDGAGTAADVSLGIASATHATDGDAIAEHCFIHLDANATAILAQSKDGSTTVAAADTTKTYAEGAAAANRVEFWMDMRDPADIQIYIEGVLVLPSSVFNLGAAVGPLFLLAHLEKTSAADVYAIYVDRLQARFAKQ